MSYYRLYPKSTNTIVKTNKPVDPYKEINSGKLTIMELHKGKMYSELLFKFEIPNWIKDNWNKVSKVNIKLYDAGAIYSNVLGETTIEVSSFYDDFMEGNGFSLLLNNSHRGFSNYIYSDDEGTLWNTKNTTTDTLEYRLDKVDQDIELDVKDIIDEDEDFVCFKVNVKHQDFGEDNKTKFIFSKHSTTIYKPYLEFFIEDEILDKRHDFKRDTLNKVYLINFNNEDFNGTITCDVNGTDENVENEGNGIYSVEFDTSSISNIIKLEWFLNGDKIKQDIINLKDSYSLEQPNTSSITSYISESGNTNNSTYRVGDIIKFDVMSFQKGISNFSYADYEFRVITNTGFEMCPWSKCNVYENKIFFFIDTSYFYPELSYEISLRRIGSNNSVKTNKENFKFKLINQSGHKLHDFSNNPYYTRDWFFSAK